MATSVKESVSIDYKDLFESLPGLYLILSPNFKIVAVSDSYLSATLTVRENILSKNLFEIFPDNPDDPTADGVTNLRASLNYVLENKTIHTMAVQKYDVRNPDGSFEEKYWSPINKPILDDKGQLLGIVHRVEDVTAFIKEKQERVKIDKLYKKEQKEREKTTEQLLEQVEKMEAEIYKRAQEIQKMNTELERKVIERTEKLIAGEIRFRNTLDKMLEGVQIIGRDWRYIYVNDSLANHGRSTKSELIGCTMMEKYPGIENTEVFKEIKKCMEQQVSYQMENEFYYPDGTKAWFELSIQPVPEGVFILSIDITDRKKAEDVLKKTFKEVSDYKFAIDQSCIVEIADQKGIIKHVNDNFCRISGYNKEELIGNDHRIVNSGYHSKKFIKDIWVTIANGKVWRGELKNKAKNGTFYWVDTTIIPFLNDDGKPYQYVVIRDDITERKSAEAVILKLNEELELKVVERTSQLEAVNKELEAFSYSVSHDLRAPLRAVNGYAKMLEEDYEKVLDDEAKRLLSRVQYNASKMGTLIDDLLAFSRLGKKDLQKINVNMNEIAEGAYREADRSVKHNAAVIISPLHEASADYGLMNQVFANLISNAIKYSSKVEKPVVNIRSEKNDTEVIYSVHDNGVGFDMKYAHKLFGVFQRLHKMDEFEGTGVGLALVQRIVNKHGGKVWAEAKPSEGASFFFSLPLASK